MRLFVAPALHLAIFSSILFFGSTTNGDEQQIIAAAYQCQNNQIVIVDFNKKHGVDDHHKDIYVCPGNTVTWQAGPHVAKFTVTFTDDYPFFGAPQPYSGDAAHDSTSTVMLDFDDVSVFKYSVSITDDNNNIHNGFDPHVVGGGGLTIDLKTAKRVTVKKR